MAPIYLWGDSDTAFMAASKRHEELVAAKVHELLGDPARRERMGRAAREVALRELDWKVLGGRLAAIIRAVQEAGRLL